MKNSKMISLFVLASVMLATPSALSEVTVEPALANRSGTSRPETKAQFNYFLEQASAQERIQLLQALRALPKIEKDVFGQLSSTVKVDGNDVELKLLSWDSYADDEKESQKTGKPIRPETYNDIAPALVACAAFYRKLDSNLWTPLQVKKEIQNANSVFWSSSVKSLDYAEIVKKIARNDDVISEKISKYKVDGVSTYELSGLIFLRRIEKLTGELLKKAEEDGSVSELIKNWNLTGEQRRILLSWDNAESYEKEQFCLQVRENFLKNFKNNGSLVVGSNLDIVMTATIATLAIHGAASGAIVGYSTAATGAIVAGTATVAVAVAAVGTAVAVAATAPFVYYWGKSRKNAEKMVDFVIMKYIIETQMRTENRLYF